MRKDDLNMHVFQNRNYVTQNLIDDYFSHFDCQRAFPQEGF